MFTSTGFITVVVLLFAEPAWAEYGSKMVAKEVSPDSPLGGIPDDGRHISSKNYMGMGPCGPKKSFEFRVGAGSGRGVVGVSNHGTLLTFSILGGSSGTVKEGGKAEPNFFALANDLDFPAFYGIPIEFKDIPANGATVSVTCTIKEAQIIAITKDEADLPVEATVQMSTAGDEEVIELAEGSVSATVLRGNSKHASIDQEITWKDGSNHGITMKRNKPGAIAMIQLELEHDGKRRPRTLLVKTRPKSPPIQEIKILLNAQIDEVTGDVEIKFRGVGNPSYPVLIEARVSIDFDEGGSLDVVDIASMVSDGTVRVHNEWFRRAFLNSGHTDVTEGWEVKVDVIAKDPLNSYSVIGHTSSKESLRIRNLPIERKMKLTERPQGKEISLEMMQGRMPASIQNRQRQLRAGRELSGTHKKILVHGYCSNANAWDLTQFDASTTIEFSDPNSAANPAPPQSWSHDEFARKINQFAVNNNIHGCGCIAHSQGGAACLHLYTYYWSCLDYAEYGGSRTIQSVGTPYQGTALAGNLAVLGEVFGVGCGTNNDLTYSGASSWLSGIPSSARSKVSYYTTSFKDNWWSYDYCHAATDLLLTDPDDGTTEKWSGQLSGANNLGHKEGWCHTSGMRDAAQTQDSGRNSIMNSNAKY